MERARWKALAIKRGIQGADHSRRGSLCSVARRVDLGRLRSRGDHRGAGGCRFRITAPGPSDHCGDRGPLGNPGLFVPPSHRRVPGRRWRLRRVSGQLGRRHQSGGWCGVDRRLHADCRGLDSGRSGCPYLCLSESDFGHSSDLPRHPCSHYPSQSERSGGDGTSVPATHDALHRRALGRHRHRSRPPLGTQ